MSVPSLDDPRRTSPPRTGGERAMLDGWLDYHRATLLLKVDDLTAEQRAACPVPTSLLSLHGLVRHMTEVERTWFSRIDGVPRRPGLYWSEADPDGDMDLTAADWEADLRAWAHWCAVSREVAARHDLDDTGESSWGAVSLRWVYVHMIEEYARHNGHADLIRELVGGSVGE